MAEKEFRQEGENSQSGRDGYKSYNREGYNKYGRGEKSNSYGRRPYNNNREGGEGYRSSYNPRFNNNNGEDRPQRGGYGNRPQRPYGNRPYNNEGGEQRSSYNPRFNNNNGGRPQRPYGNRPYNNNNEGGEQRPYRPRFNNGGQQSGEQRSYRPRFNNGGQQGGYGRPQGGYRPRTADYNPNAKYSMKKQIEYKDVLTDPDEPIRLNKFLANAGICSRREADEFITAGVVSVNGEIVTELGTKVKRSDEVKFHDQPVSIERKVYVLLNKPKDCVTTSDDPQERKTVMDFVKGACKERIYPVGRLDRNTTGVLLLTNDGDLASKLTHPKFLKKKIYHVYCDKNVTKADLDQIVQGITLDDGEIHADAISYASDTDKSQVGIEIHSGKNRIVRRIFESLGYRVVKLDRVYFAGLTKKGLRRGDWRYLTEQEVAMLRMGSFE
ncbi:pseudouridine synthase [uncultured Bacteroides sp.]|uniref:pseudouridine synthase n=1 Tax=uncultured Bacteroides sp. TaxID=162156 RepID=UPI00258F6F21|nr:pseudouridine synthase [uncultured Bacteroides sp.]